MFKMYLVRAVTCTSLYTESLNVNILKVYVFYLKESRIRL